MTLTGVKSDSRIHEAVVSRREESIGTLSTACLWQQFKTHHCIESRNTLIDRYAHLVTITAGRLFGPMPSGVERGDLEGAGALGLVKAVDQFDPERKIKFETYAIALIRGTILDMFRRDDWVPRLVRDQQKQLKLACIKLEACAGRPATEDEIAAEMGIERKTLDKLRSSIGRANVLSLDDLRIGREQQRLVDLLPTDAPSPLDSVALCERQRALAVAIDRLPDRERAVVALYYYEGLTFKEVSIVLTVSEARAFQLHTQAVTRLRGYLQAEQDMFPE